MSPSMIPLAPRSRAYRGRKGTMMPTPVMATKVVTPRMYRGPR